MIKIVMDDRIPYLRERLEGKTELMVLSPEEITPETVADADCLIVRTRTKCNEVLLKDSKVKLVFTATIGTDHIDREWCETAGISVGSGAGCNSPAVAQYVISALDRSGFDIQNHTLGIVGKGHIGSIITEIVRRSGGKVLVCDPPRKEAGYMDENYIPLEELLGKSDAVSFHVPLVKTGSHPTLGLLHAGNISLLKENATVINASRGGVISEEAVIAAPGKGKWIIDTWENEPFINQQMMDLAFISTPHIAGYSREGKERASRRAVEAINSMFDTKISTEGLADYDFNPQNFDFKSVAQSYDIMEDSLIFRKHSYDLEELRDTYVLRKEP